ncbi:MAG: DUF1566 domain-containing protein [Proteobacteria bacterium]|nr:DUF1566 domain-containing protein [Pseudomonadota bacterium]MBU1420534.1 DUF1566 domain-containing protein [Pseudomonadota bacterium]MBU1456097.1 DUF1566 domain-containing protein [Pseudomonadota bacterium]
MSRFKEQNEVVIDKKTGLMWTKNASLSSFSMTWNEALTFIKDLNHSELNGYSDWKLPNRRELFSIISHKTINPCLPLFHPFVNIFTSYYWTSTSCARQTDQAWYIHLGGARVFKGKKYDSYMVWPVRIAETHNNNQVFQTGQQNCFNESGVTKDCHNTGQDGEFAAEVSYNRNRFTENTHIIKDSATGLTWLKNANIYRDAADWNTSFDLIFQMNREKKYGHNDWRIPNIVELESLTDMSRHSPALPADHPFIDVQDFYWSSTTSMYETNYAWVLYMIDGAVGVGYKPLPEFYIWPVSGN